ncbi:MAG: hypothetical protein RLP14_08945 [Owenweeksia sp.]
MAQRTIILLALALTAFSGYSQKLSDKFKIEENDSSKTVKPVKEAPTSFYDKFAVAVNGSTLGIGLEVARNLTPHLNIRLRGNMFSLKNYTLDLEMGGEPVHIDASSNFMEFDLCAEYLPFKRSSFKLVGGMGYFMKADANAHAVYDGELEYGDITMTSDDIGTMDFNIDYKGFAPYLGFGFGRAVPKKRVGLGLEVGTFYLSKPAVTIDATQMLEPTEGEQAELEENLSDYRWLPFINLRLAIRI